MENLAEKQNPQPELARPGLNPFMEVLAANLQKEKESTPVQRLHDHLKEMEKAAHTGDIPGWQALLPEVLEMFETMQLPEERKLAIQVKVKQWELTLLLKAGARALREAKALERQAADDQIEDEGDEVREKLMRAERLTRLGEQLHAQLQEKLAE